MKRQTLILSVVFILSLAWRFHEYYYFREMNTDKARQLHGAYQLLQGHGVSLESYDLQTFKPAYFPLVEWPPGYSYLVAAVSFSTGTGVYHASFLLDCFCLAALWLCLAWLLSLLDFTLWQRCLLFVFLGVSKTPLNFIFSSDLLGTLGFLAACGLSIWHTKSPRQNRKPRLFFLGQFLCMALMIFLKYSLLPAAFTIGASFIAYSFLSKEKFYKTGLLLLSIAGLCVVAVFLVNEMRSGHINGLYVRYAAQERTLHLGNLSLFNPFIVAAFVHLDLFFHRFNISLVNGIAVALTAGLFIAITVAIAKKIRFRQASFFDYLVCIGLFSVVGFLVILSVYFPKDDHPIIQWTYVKEFRYFAPAVFLVILYLWKNLRFNARVINSQNLVSAFTLASIAFAVGLGVYYFASHNEAASYTNMNGKFLRMKHVVDSLKNDQTYFISLTCHAGDDPNGRLEDTKAESVVAASGTNVVVTAEGYFPDSCYTALFSKSSLLPAGKKVIVFFDDNTKVLDSMNFANRHLFGQTAFGEKYLVLNN